MRICLCCNLIPAHKNLVKKSKKRLVFSENKLMYNLIEGLDKGGNLTVLDHFNIFPYPDFEEKIIHTEMWENNGGKNYHLGFLNISGLVGITQCVGFIKYLNKWIRENKKEKNVILTYNIRMQNVCALAFIKLLYPKTKICIFIGDLVGQMGVGRDDRTPRKKLRKILANFTLKLIRRFDAFIPVTKEIMEYLKIEDKPYVVVDGMCSTEDIKEGYKNEALDSKEKIICYAGAMRKNYDIPLLLEAFKLIKDPSYKLWLIGSGDADNLVKEYAKDDPRITLYGACDSKKVSEIQKNASILVNPRTNSHEYVKYSFPSKTIEGLSSGKPFIGFKLICFGEEYDRVIEYPNKENAEELAKKIYEVGQLSNDEIMEIGKRNLEFVRSKKSDIQCEKILQLFKQI